MNVDFSKHPFVFITILAIAGILLGQLHYKYEMISQVKGLKEFFAVSIYCKRLEHSDLV